MARDRLTASSPALAAIGEPTTDVYVSALSVAEISIRSPLGRLSVQGELAGGVEESGFSFLPFTGEHATGLADIPWHHRDPFDRMLIVQAMVDSKTFASSDPACRSYDVRLLF